MENNFKSVPNIELEEYTDSFDSLNNTFRFFD